MQSLMWRTTTLVVLLTAHLLMPAAASAGTVIVTSTFDHDLEGWTATEPDEVAWAPAGGNPDGYLRFEELSGVNTSIIAPPPFLGDWSTLDGSGSLEYDHKIFFTGGDVYAFLPYRILISGPGGSAEWVGDTPSGNTDWVHMSAEINEADWNVLSGSWSALLADVAVLQIRIEQIGNWNNHDIDGIDNVALIRTCADTTTSTFDHGLECWTAEEPGSITWASIGGNPGGYIHFEDTAGYIISVIAPPAFLGDWSALDGIGSLEYEHKVIFAGDAIEDLPYRIWISGPGGSAQWIGETPHGPTDWVLVSAPINEADWEVLSGTWSDLLANVEDLRIRIEHFGNQNQSDIAGIDNVRLISPCPGSADLDCDGDVDLEDFALFQRQFNGPE